MNHSYRLVWNQEAQRYVPAPECAKGRGKSKAGKALAPAAVLLAAAFALPTWAAPPAANALPTGGQVVSGNASIGQSGSQMTVNQSSPKAIIDWTSFDIGKNAGVTFVQPNANAVALNRVTAGDASQIHGQLNANGQVWLINPNGVVFGQGSKVDVGGLVASTLNITNADFNNGNYRFTRNGATGSISNQGEITAKDGGTIALLAPTVRNDRIIRAQLGTVAMAAGDQITLQAGANGLLNVQVDPATVRTLIENKQLIVADGGQVIMTGKAADALSASVVANTGTIQANSLQAKDGKILLIADMRHGETKAAGQFEAKFVDTSAATVSIDKDLKVNTAGGEWLIDPVNITIDANKAQAIEAALGKGNVTVSTADVANNTGWGGGTNGTGSDPGDIHVNADITYTANQLTLRADRDINVNAHINVNGAGTLALNHGSSANVNVKGQVNFEKTGTDLLAINGANYTVIKDVTALQGMSGTSHFALGGHIDASATAGWNGGAGFNPLGLSGGVFDGLGHTISGLTINRPDLDNVGLFGRAENSTLRNVGLVGGSVAGRNDVGALVGWNVAHSGGTARITNAYATGNVTGNGTSIGGLVGSSAANGGTAIISHAYATGNVTGPSHTGGLVGTLSAGGAGATSSITHAYATGRVQGGAYAGGLLGYNTVGSNGVTHIEQAYATGAVSGTTITGGLVGLNYANGGTVRIRNTYWDRASTGKAGVGEGASENGGTLDINNNAAIDDTNRYQHASYAQLGTWSETTTGSGVWQAADAAGVQWIMIEGQTRPFLASEYSTTIRNAHQLQLMAYDLGASYRLTSHIDASATAGSNASGMWSSQGFSPVGTGESGVDKRPFTGAFDGQGHTIGGLTINRGGQNYVGLFGWSAGTLRNVGLVGGSIVGRLFTGALAGLNNGVITNVYATTSVSGYQDVGGLVGRGFESSRITNAYATGAVHASDGYVGGLIGLNNGRIANTYASGTVTSATSSSVGALAGFTSDDITASFWNTETQPGMSGVGGGHGDPTVSVTGKTTAELQQLKTFADAGWDIDDAGGSGKVWRIYDGHSGPLLRGFLTQVTADIGDFTSVTAYDGTIRSGSVGSYTPNVPGAALQGQARFTTTSANAGTYRVQGGTLGVSGLWSDSQQGYDISYAGSYTIDRATLTVSGTTVANKTYDASRDASVTAGSLVGLVAGETLGVSASGYFDSKNAGVGKTVTAQYTLADGSGPNAGLASNYRVDSSTHTATIDRAGLTITVNDASKLQGMTGSLNGSTGFTATGLQGGERIASVTLASDGTRADAKVGKHGILASNAQGGWGFDASNYDLTYEAGTLTVTPGVPEGGNIWHAQHPQLLAGAPAFATLPAGQPAGGVPFLELEPGYIRVPEVQ
ncbi:filamentous hemagglutinin N-terminal domain-containing protein [Comamonas sp. GB3 AK4-5]|uniref:two-partner secretion domain-containing protein n=1 Tax=Comamonas sp. GB3 AK4-5 TaxID=3231487 RepID=UPI00351F545B